MVKKCIICGEEAVFKIKDTSDYYCQECAEDNFSDLSLLIKVEEEAQKLRNYLKEKMDDLLEDEEKLDEMISLNESESFEDSLKKNKTAKEDKEKNCEENYN